eukprot:5002729-Pleurochrysis_carterae.AAC.3
MPERGSVPASRISPQNPNPVGTARLAPHPSFVLSAMHCKHLQPGNISARPLRLAIQRSHDLVAVQKRQARAPLQAIRASSVRNRKLQCAWHAYLAPAAAQANALSVGSMSNRIAAIASAETVGITAVISSTNHLPPADAHFGFTASSFPHATRSISFRALSPAFPTPVCVCRAICFLARPRTVPSHTLIVRSMRAGSTPPTPSCASASRANTSREIASREIIPRINRHTIARPFTKTQWLCQCLPIHRRSLSSDLRSPCVLCFHSFLRLR